MDEVLAQVITEQGIEGLGRYYSSYRAYVTKNVDPQGMGRIKVCVPEVNGVILWAISKGQHGGFNNGFKYLTPHIGDTVWVEFEGGDLSKPIWSYYSWAQGEIPIELHDPNVMGFVTPNGNIVTLDESDNHVDVYIKGSVSVHSDDIIDISSAKQVRINSGNNGGVINIEDITNKLNGLVKEIEQLKAAYNSHTHTGNMGSPTSPPIIPHNNTFSTFNKSDYEDTKFTH